MKRALLLLLGLACWSVIAWRPHRPGDSVRAAALQSSAQKFQATGLGKEVAADRKSIVLQHDAISNYMPAMTMSFKVWDTNQLGGVQAGDAVSFRLLVRDDESWIDHVKRINSTLPVQENSIVPTSKGSGGGTVQPATEAGHPLMHFQFTNELGARVTLASFRGQALAITFFFTRCPIPEYCPRLSRNFEEASKKLAVMPNGPTNWHFLSVSIDPAMDTPTVLKAYAHRYHYDSNHWSFLTGPADKIRELATESGVTYEPDGPL